MGAHGPQLRATKSMVSALRPVPRSMCAGECVTGLCLHYLSWCLVNVVRRCSLLPIGVVICDLCHPPRLHCAKRLCPGRCVGTKGLWWLSRILYPAFSVRHLCPAASLVGADVNRYAANSSHLPSMLLWVSWVSSLHEIPFGMCRELMRKRVHPKPHAHLSTGLGGKAPKKLFMCASGSMPAVLPKCHNRCK